MEVEKVSAVQNQLVLSISRNFYFLKVTTKKKSTLILNVDGAIAACFVDLLRHCGAFEQVSIYLQQIELLKYSDALHLRAKPMN